MLRKSDPTQKIVQCHGVFDLLHIGHIRHLEEGKRNGDLLVVTLTPDRFVNKGAHRPAFTEQLRAEAVASLDCVDYVAVNEWPTAVEAITLLKPHFYVKGADYNNPDKDRTGKIGNEEAAVQSGGGSIVFTDDIVFSSSNLINKHLSPHSKEMNDYLDDFTGKFSVDDVIKYLDGAEDLKVLVIGEAIIDEYQYCEQIGKSSKEPILATRYMSTEKFGGGILAVANHLANFCQTVSIVTFLGDVNPQEEFIRQSLNSRVNANFFQKSESPTIVKRRIVENFLLQKLFEIYEINDDELEQSDEDRFCEILEKVVPEHDLVIVVDYGHGMMTKRAIDLVCDKAKFLAVNTQSNAANRGFNTISRYPKADYVCLAGNEIALEERKRQGDLREMILNVSTNLNSQKVTVTRSKYGNLCYRQGDGFTEAPAFTGHVVDRVGAGDAVLALSSLLAVQDAPMEILGLLGNVVGAEAVATMGHRSSIEKLSLSRHIESLLK